jgi:hypothetical protein
MTIPELVEKLQANQYRTDAIARIIGYIVMIQGLGWDELRLSRQSKSGLQKTFRSIGIDPHTIRI